MTPEQIAELAAIAAQTADHTETKAGGDFEYTPAPAGVGVARLIEYIELGKQKQAPYQGKPKADAEFVRLTFELLSGKNIKEIEVDGVKKKIADRISLNLNVNLGEKAKFKKLFNAMVYGRSGITHFAQMVGQAFLVTIHHNPDKADPKKIYANLNDKDGNYTIGAPRQQTKEADAIAGTPAEYKDISALVPQPISPLKVFFWGNPTQETWDSLFIDGTRKQKNDKGEEVEVSSNWLQEKIKGATNFNGSGLQMLLKGIPDNLPTTEGNSGTTAEASTVNASPSEQALQELADSKPAETTAAEDLSALGL